MTFTFALSFISLHEGVTIIQYFHTAARNQVTDSF